MGEGAGRKSLNCGNSAFSLPSRASAHQPTAFSMTGLDPVNQCEPRTPSSPHYWMAASGAAMESMANSHHPSCQRRLASRFDTAR